MEFIKIIDSVDKGITYNGKFLPEKYINTEYNEFFIFNLKHYSIVNRMIYLNSKIKYLWKEWEDCSNEPTDNSDEMTLVEFALKHNAWQENLINSYFSKEEFIACLRKVIDECLVLYCVAKNKYKKSGNPLESIGEYLEQKDRFKDFNQYIDFFELINNISNSYKHSIINCQFEIVNRSEPDFYVYCTKEDKTGQYNYFVNPIWVSLDYLIIQFNNFYSYFDNIIKN